MPGPTMRGSGATPACARNPQPGDPGEPAGSDPAVAPPHPEASTSSARIDVSAPTSRRWPRALPSESVEGLGVIGISESVAFDYVVRATPRIHRARHSHVSLPRLRDVLPVAELDQSLKFSAFG